MARTPGTFPVSFNLEPRIKGPLDARTIVDTYDDLTGFTAGNYLKNGFIVSVFDPLPSKRGVYQLIDETNLGATASWVLIGANGPQGASGSIGTNGNQGFQGPQGFQGSTGSAETPLTELTISGTQNSINKIFTLSSPLTVGTQHMFFINGQLLVYGPDYTISGTTLTLTADRPAPSFYDSLRIFGSIGNIIVGIAGPQGATGPTYTYVPQITITTSTNITTDTLASNGLGQNGRNVIIDNGVNPINLTINGGTDFCSSYVKHGSGAITFVQGIGRTMVQVDSTAVLNGVVGSTAVISSIGTTDYLRISNA